MKTDKNVRKSLHKNTKKEKKQLHRMVTDMPAAPTGSHAPSPPLAGKSCASLAPKDLGKIVRGFNARCRRVVFTLGWVVEGKEGEEHVVGESAGESAEKHAERGVAEELAENVEARQNG